ncbi:hypothetical protein HYC85_029627 [Camellia sinensis]|uniref:EDS1 EP domain-containing protein n=1 Tax=Camellia sinensis TaxID=4442 RepID=A0A7J7G2I2_CAMSI|nr:hypothetical protein HYC85_029627 [Camellia sinensis]
MVGERLGERIKVREELIKKACSLSFKAHKSPGKPYLLEKVRGRALPEVIFVFSGSWSIGDWFSSTSGKAFGETKVDLDLFPSLRNIGNVDEVAAVNDAFFRRFEEILRTSSFENEVKKAVTDKKQIVFAGHSSGAATAILATLWFLDHYLQVQPNKTQTITPRCITFGSPLLGDRIFPHSLCRENWDNFFIHFITKHDIVPRITLSPPSSIQQDFQTFLSILKTKSPITTHENVSNFFVTVMKNVQSVTSHAACNMMGSTNPLLQTITSFVQLSPYRPFGTYILCSGNGKLVVVENSDAVLQLLFYSCQLKSGQEIGEVGYESLTEHSGYENELEGSLEMQNVVYLDNYLKEVPLSSDASVVGEAATVNAALNDLGLSTRARLCLRAAGELQEQKQRNERKINSNKKEIEEKLKIIQDYQKGCTLRKVGYYDTFKIQKDDRDFHANVRRVELAGLWDEIIEMLKRYELPDEFEGRKEWIELGTKYRRLVEPLDIANYYRHSKNEDTGPYLVKARPKRYRYTQRWHEHAERMAQGSSSESCFWAEVEELKSRNKPDEDMGKILELEKDLSAWVERGEIGRDMFLGESTFAKWWRELPEGHKRGSCLAQFMNN